MEVGDYYIIYLYLDEVTDRLVGSNKWSKYVEREDIELEEGQEVDLMIAEGSNLGVKVIINDTYEGLIFQNEIFHEIHRGDSIKGYIKNIREDGKIDVSLQPLGYKNKISKISNKVLTEIKNRGGFLNLTDKSAPGEIYAQLEMSKKSFKKALGSLYKARKVNIDDEDSKSGVSPAELPALAHACSELPGLKLRGLMCLPAIRDGEDEQRKPFARLRELAEALGRDGLELDTLSMGMSGDYPAAIAEGATIVRVGTALFGARDNNGPLT